MNMNIEYEMAATADTLNCLNDPQIIANWNQTVIYVAHFIRNKSMMHAFVQFNSQSSKYAEGKKGRLFLSCVCVSGDPEIWSDTWRSVEINVFFSLFIASSRVNDSCHSSKRYILRRQFLTVINYFDFRIWLVSMLENGCSNHLCGPSNVKIKLN